MHLFKRFLVELDCSFPRENVVKGLKVSLSCLFPLSFSVTISAVICECAEEQEIRSDRKQEGSEAFLTLCFYAPIRKRRNSFFPFDGEERGYVG